jgi:hypothetical protein
MFASRAQQSGPDPSAVDPLLVNMGRYRYPASLEDPMAILLIHVATKPGLSQRAQAGRAKWKSIRPLLRPSSATFTAS